jgi:hypothetical protein
MYAFVAEDELGIHGWFKCYLNAEEAAEKHAAEFGVRTFMLRKKFRGGRIAIETFLDGQWVFRAWYR